MQLLLFMLFGFLIMMIGQSVRKKGKVSFISGAYEVFIPKHEEKLATQIGGVIVLFGLTTILFLVSAMFFKQIEGFYFAVLAVLHLFAVFIFMLLDQIQ